MNGSPSALTSRAPSPRSASDSRKRGWPSTWSAVGWNCTNSRSATRAPAAQAIAIPSPDATSGLVVSRNTWPAPPVASSVARARAVRRVPSGSRYSTPTARPSSTRIAVARACSTAWMRACAAVRAHKRAADRPPGGVARVQHAADAVRRLAGQRDLAVRLAIEGRPPVHQLVDVGRALGRRECAPRGRRRARRRRPACPSRAARDRRRRPPRRRCRPGRSRCCPPPRPPWSAGGPARTPRAPARPGARRSRCRR